MYGTKKKKGQDLIIGDRIWEEGSEFEIQDVKAEAGKIVLEVKHVGGAELPSSMQQLNFSKYEDLEWTASLTPQEKIDILLTVVADARFCLNGHANQGKAIPDWLDGHLAHIVAHINGKSPDIEGLIDQTPVTIDWSKFEALEVNPLRIDYDSTQKQLILEKCAENDASIWSVYGHLNSGGVEWIADLDSKKNAYLHTAKLVQECLLPAKKTAETIEVALNGDVGETDGSICSTPNNFLLSP